MTFGDAEALFSTLEQAGTSPANKTPKAQRLIVVILIVMIGLVVRWVLN